MESQSHFGPYRLLEPLGEGGSGQVWKALDLRLERVVALKVLKVVDEDQRLSLVTEAKTACQLHHPNIAVIFEAGEVEGTPFIAMEFIEGRTLRARAGTPQPEVFLRKFLSQATSALEHAHGQGIIHRDIKPDNFLITAGGELKLLDFGVAKRAMASPEDCTTGGFTLTGETMQGISMGTPGYMSPEQAHGQPLDPTTDQFSLGLTAFELAAGFHPFRKPSLLATLQAIAHEPAPNLGLLRADLSPSLVRVLHRMLEKDRRHRFPSMDALQGALANPVEAPQPSIRHSWLRWAGVALLVFGAALGWRFRGRSLTRLGVEGKGRRVVAVLPFELQGMPDAHRWLGDSFQDAVATGLLRRGDLLVLDRWRVAEATAEAGGPGKVGALLSADLLLMGTLQASGEHLRLSLRLIRAPMGEVLDQIQFEGNLTDTLILENDLGKQVPALFGPSTLDSLPGQATARLRHTRERYIVGMEQMVKASEVASKEAVVAFEDAIRSEPDYAPAHAGLAWALGSLAAQEAHLGNSKATPHMERAIEEARTAVKMDGTLPLAHQILGRILVRLGNHADGRQSLERAIALDPADYRALAALGDSFAYQDDEPSHTQARSHLLRALELSPRYWWAHFRLGVLFQNEGNLKEAVFHADRAIQLEPSADYPHLVAGLSLLWRGDLPAATQRIEEGLRQVPGSGLLQLTQALCDFARFDHAAFRSHAKALSGRWAPSHPVGVLLAGLEAGDGGQTGRMRDSFLSFAKANHARESASIPVQERRVLSVNAYHMARALAQAGQRAPARVLLDEAERMQRGKLKVAAQDPLLRSLP